MKKISIHIKFSHFLLLAFSLAGHVVFAQIKTVVPAIGLESLKISNTTTDIRFDLATLPKGYQVNSCQLQLVCGEKITQAAGLEVLSAGEAKINYHRLKTSYGDTTIIRLDIDKANIPADNGILTLKVRLDAPDPYTVKFYPSTINPAPKLGYKPQLVINYSPAAPATEWASTQANARHTAQSPTKFSGMAPEQFEVLTISNVKPARQNMLMYNDHLYVLSPDEQGVGLYSVDPASLKATRALGGLDARSESAPVVDAYGRFYYTWLDKIGVIDLADNFKWKKLETTIDNNVVNALTMGADGSLYVPGNDYLCAYSPFPQNQMVWKYKLAGKKSSIALNSDGKRAYVLSSLPGTKTEGLLTAIDANNGAWLANTIIEFDGTAHEDDNLPTPMVDDLGYVYLTNKLVAPTRLYVFNSNLGKQLTDTSISMAAGFSTEGGRNAKEIVFLKNRRICKYSAEYGKVVEIGDLGVKEVQSLLTDEGNNLYLLAGNQFIYRSRNGEVITLDLQDSPNKNMVLGADGTLYTSTNNKLLAIKPVKFKKGTYTTSNDDSNADNITIRAQTLLVNAGFVFSNTKMLIGREALIFDANTTLKSKSKVTLKLGKSGGGVVFKPGLKIERGAILVIKRGY